MRNLVVELMGLPKAGRSTLMRGLHRMLGSEGIFVRCFPEEARRAPFSQWHTDAFDFLASSVSETVSNVIEAEQNAEGVVIIERGVFDHMVSAIALKAAGLIGEKPAKRIIEFLQPHTGKEDLIIFLEIPVKVSLERDQGGDLTMPPGLVANPELLKHLQEAYREMLPKIPEQKRLTIHGTKPISTVREEALKAIRQRLQEGDALNPKVSGMALASVPHQSLNQKGGKKTGAIDALFGGLETKGRKLGYTRGKV